jgi:N-acetylglucosaminyl-diphospho-decaprenol L-rhamnosyltransferase
METHRPSHRQPRLVLSIVSHAQTDLVEALLQDLRHPDFRGIDLVILTLNMPTEPIPKAFVDGFPWETLLIRNEISRGFGENHNIAFERCFGYDFSGPIESVFVILNPDLRIENHQCFEILRQAMEPGIDLIAPEVVEHGVVAASARSLYTPLQATKGFLGWSRKLEIHPDWLAGMFLMFRANCYAQLMGFDLRYFMYCEDVDICLRLQLRGGRLKYCNNVQVSHFVRRDSHSSLLAFGRHLKSALSLWTSKAYWRFLVLKIKGD